MILNITLQKFVVLTVSLILAILCMIVSFSIFTFHTHHMRKLFVGSIGIITSMSMYSAPLVAVVSTISYNRTTGIFFK
jgi:solute carrier family 50 (sugar transporter)